METVQGWQTVADRNAGPCEQRNLLSPASLAGDRRTLERLLSEHEGPLLSLCRRMLGHAEDAEDAVQETFLRAVRYLDRFEQRAQLKTWLYRIAVNICLDQKRRRKPVEPLDELIPSPGGSVEREVVGAIRMEQGLRQLPERRRAIFLLKEVHGWDVAEIADTMRCRSSHVYYELREAYRALAHSLKRDDREGE